jgi:hypothetical protein
MFAKIASAMFKLFGLEELTAELPTLPEAPDLDDVDLDWLYYLDFHSTNTCEFPVEITDRHGRILLMRHTPITARQLAEMNEAQTLFLVCRHKRQYEITHDIMIGACIPFKGKETNRINVTSMHRQSLGVIILPPGSCWI